MAWPKVGGEQDEEAGSKVGKGVGGVRDGNEWDWEYGTESGGGRGILQAGLNSFGVKNGVGMGLEELLGLGMR